MLGRPVMPEARSAIAFAISMLIAVFEMCVRAEPLHIEEQPAVVGADVRAAVEKTAIDTFSVHVRSLIAASFASSDHALHLLFVLPLGEFIPKIRKRRHRIGVAKPDPFVGPPDGGH